MLHNIPVQEYCQYLNSRDIRALARTSRCIRCAIRALTDLISVRSFDISTSYLRAIFRAAAWSRIGVTIRGTVLFEFKYQPLQVIIPPTSYNYTGLIALRSYFRGMPMHICMWTTDGLIDCNIWWTGYVFSNVYVFKSAGKIHFVNYIDEIIRHEAYDTCSLQYDIARIRAIKDLSGQYAHYVQIDNVIRSVTFANILREL